MMTAMALGLFALTLATPAAAQSQDPIMQRAKQYCRGMPACLSMVLDDTLPARFLVACGTALDSGEPEGAVKSSARSMCNTALERIRKNALAQR